MDWLGLIFYFVIIIPSAIIHEYAHGFVADSLGDPTARYVGRLTVDPRAHIDRWGTIFLPLFLFFISGGRFLFAYAKPVPFNPYNLRYQKWGPVFVGLAGPAANFLLAAAFAVVLRLFPGAAMAPFLAIIIYANLTLMIFNLVPVPPLDGSKILYAVLPESAASVRAALDRYGFVIVLVLVFFFFRLLSPVIEGLFALLVGV